MMLLRPASLLLVLLLECARAAHGSVLAGPGTAGRVRLKGSGGAASGDGGIRRAKHDTEETEKKPIEGIKIKLVVQVSLTLWEATKGVHPYRLCDGTDTWPPHDHFCSFQEELPYVLTPTIDEKDPEVLGFYERCPTRNTECGNMGLSERGLADCVKECSDIFDNVAEGDRCNQDDTCAAGLFCTFASGKSWGKEFGVCKKCPLDPHVCVASDNPFDLPIAGVQSCLQCDLKCHFLKWGEVTVDRVKVIAYALGSSPLNNRPGSAYAPVVDCTATVLDSVDSCAGAEGAICLVEDFARESFPRDLARKCERGGGTGLMIYQPSGKSLEYPENLPYDNYITAPVNIPVVTIPYEQGRAIRENKIGAMTNVTVVDAGWNSCWVDQVCSEFIPCIGDYEDGYCRYVDDSFFGLWCDLCPKDATSCFFPEEAKPLVQKDVLSCTSSCGASLEFCEDCDSVVPEIGHLSSEGEACNFCQNEETLRFPDREVPLYTGGEEVGVPCWKVQSFFDRVALPADSPTCELAQDLKQICGCDVARNSDAFVLRQNLNNVNHEKYSSRVEVGAASFQASASSRLGMAGLLGLLPGAMTGILSLW